MTSWYALDRWEGDMAVLEKDDGHCHSVPRKRLPAGAVEGDVLREQDGVFAIDREETDRRREAVRALQEKLRRKRS